MPLLSIPVDEGQQESAVNKAIGRVYGKSLRQFDPEIMVGTGFLFDERRVFFSGWTRDFAVSFGDISWCDKNRINPRKSTRPAAGVLALDGIPESSAFIGNKRETTANTVYQRMESAPSLDSERALALLAHSNDQAAWAFLVERHGRDVYRVCRRILAESHLAEDACQETFLNMRRSAANFRASSSDPEAGARAWIIGIAGKISLFMLRTRIRAIRRDQRAGESMRNENQSHADDRQDHLIAAVRRELAALDESAREPLMLHFFAQLDNHQVAQALGCSEVNARVRVHRALERLRGRMARAGMACSATILAAAVSSAMEAAEDAPIGLLAKLAADHGSAPTITVSQTIGGKILVPYLST